MISLKVNLTLNITLNCYIINRDCKIHKYQYYISDHFNPCPALGGISRPPT